MSFSEIIFVVLLGLVVFGPKKLVHVGKQVGQALAAFKKATSEFQSQLSSEILTAEQQQAKLQTNHPVAEPPLLESGLPGRWREEPTSIT